MQYLDFTKNYIFFGNTLYDYLLAFLILIGSIILLKIFQIYVLAKIKKITEKTKTDFDDKVLEVFKKIKPPFYFFVALFVSIKFLILPAWLNKAIQIILLLVIVYEVVLAIQRLVDYFVQKYINKSTEQKDKSGSQSMIRALGMIVKVVLWSIGIILILSNLGINVTSLVAGIGIGGIAIALAVQNILSDVFSSFSIYIDKPFKVGDFITVGTDSGTVENIGLKTTRLKTLQGEELVVANKELTTVRIQNFKKMEKRRVSFALGLVYGTKQEILEDLPNIIEDIIAKIPLTKFDRCHFESFLDSSLNFQVVYFVNSSEYIDFVKIQNQVNLEIYKEFTKRKINFAFPSQSIYLHK